MRRHHNEIRFPFLGECSNLASGIAESYVKVRLMERACGEAVSECILDISPPSVIVDRIPNHSRLRSRDDWQHMNHVHLSQVVDEFASRLEGFRRIVGKIVRYDDGVLR